MGALLALFPPVGHDQLWCLYVAQRMLAGAKLYGPELFESNPPLIMWASLLLAHLAQMTHLPITVLFKLAVSGLELASAYVSLELLRRIYPVLSRMSPWVPAFFYVVIFEVMPARDFGQRDHLLAILCLPCILSAALDVKIHRGGDATQLPTAVRILMGVAAAIGICLKPHHVLALLTTEFLVALSLSRQMPRPGLRRGLRPEFVALALTGLGYVFAVLHFAPVYLSQVVPLLKDVYWAIGHLTPLELAGESIQLHLLLAVTLVAVFLRGRSNPAGVLLLAAGVASTIAYYLQGTGWYYQQIPALSFTACALAVMMLSALESLRFVDRPAVVSGALGLSLLALGLTAHFTGYPFIPSRSFPIDTPDESFFRGLAPGTPVAMLTTSVDDTVMPTAKYHLVWAQRTNNLWILPALLRNESGPRPQHVIPAARLAELEAMQHRFMVEDLARWHPKLILVDRCQDPKVQCQVIEDRHDDLLAWFSRDPAFREAFAPYRYVGSKGDFDAYRLP